MNRPSTAFDTPDDGKPVQRTVPAANAAPVATRAASSVFSVSPPVKAKRKALPPLDLSKLVIRDGVPMPPPPHGGKHHGPGKYEELLGLLQPGQSVVLTHVYCKALASAAKKRKLKFSVRKLDHDHTGFWRLKD